MRLILLSRRPDVYSMRRLVEEGTRLDLDLHVADPEAYQFSDPNDLIWPRLGLWRFQEAISHLLPFESGGAHFVNGPSALLFSRDKWRMSQALTRADLPHPETRQAPDWQRQTPWLAKPRFGGQGFGIQVVHDANELNSLDPNWEWIYQEIIPVHDKIADVRILLDENGVIASMAREKSPQEIRSNLTCGGTARPYSPSSALIALAEQARRISGLRIAGVDLLARAEKTNDNQWFVLEVNGSPGFEGLESVSGVNVARRLLEGLKEGR